MFSPLANIHLSRAMDTDGGGISKSTIAAIIMGIIAGLLLFLVALMYWLNRKKKLGQFEWNIFKRDSWNFSKPETARRVRREDVTEGFELDGGGYAAVMTSEGIATRTEYVIYHKFICSWICLTIDFCFVLLGRGLLGLRLALLQGTTLRRD